MNLHNKAFEMKKSGKKTKGEKMLSGTLNTRAILKGNLRYVRSDVPTVITEEDKQWLISNNIITIIDLRTPQEQLEKPCPLMKMEQFKYYTVSLTGGSDIPKTPALVAQSYINMADEKLAQAIQVAMNASTNVLYFCNMGKDRTGVLSAAILKKLGMSNEYIVDDYVATYENVKDILDAYAKSNPEVDINVITPKGEYIETFLQWYDEEFMPPPPIKTTCNNKGATQCEQT